MGLPSGAKRLEYIQSSGTQYINLGFKPDANTRVVCDFQLVSVDTTNRAIFGVVGQFSFRKYDRTTFRTNGSNNVDFTKLTMIDRYTVDKSATSTTLGGQTKATTAATCSYNLFLCAYNNSGTAANFSLVKIFSFKAYDGTMLTLDLIPCQLSGGDIGMWDNVSDTFYGNSGSGVFTAGPVVVISGGGATLIGGTAYAIKAGKVLIGGTAYGMTVGKTLVGGTAYSIEFSGGMVVVTITGAGSKLSNKSCYARIDNTIYIAPATLELQPGDTIMFSIFNPTRSSVTSRVIVDGEILLERTRTSTGIGTVDWTIPTGVKRIAIDLSIGKGDEYCTIDVITS